MSTAWTEDRAVRRAFLLEISTFPLHSLAHFVCKFIHLRCLRSLPPYSIMLWAHSHRFHNVRMEAETKTKQKTEIDVKYDNILWCSLNRFFFLPRGLLKMVNICLIMVSLWHTLYRFNGSIFDRNHSHHTHTNELNAMNTARWLQAIFWFNCTLKCSHVEQSIQ